MSKSLGDACDEILDLGLLDHEYGVPVLWPRTAPLIQKASAEQSYYHKNKELMDAIDRLVLLNHTLMLKQRSPQEIHELYDETFTGPLANKSHGELSRFLQTMASFKTKALNADFLTAAPPILRAIYHDNLSLTDAEFTTLNNLKKLYSHYNEHPANIRRLITEQRARDATLSEKAIVQVEIEDILSESIGPKLAQLRSQAVEFRALQNAYSNAVMSGQDESQEKKLRQALNALRKVYEYLSILSDLLPGLVLLQASNWFSDEALRLVVEDCQDVAEKLSRLPDLKNISVSEILQLSMDSFSL